MSRSVLRGVSWGSGNPKILGTTNYLRLAVKIHAK